jgi:hypothetical protein
VGLHRVESRPIGLESHDAARQAPPEHRADVGKNTQ